VIGCSGRSHLFGGCGHGPRGDQDPPDIPIAQDSQYATSDAIQFNNWGSPFSSGAHFLFGDGSVRLIPFGKNQAFRANFRTLLTPNGGTPSAELQ